MTQSPKKRVRKQWRPPSAPEIRSDEDSTWAKVVVTILIIIIIAKIASRA